MSRKQETSARQTKLALAFLSKGDPIFADTHMDVGNNALTGFPLGNTTQEGIKGRYPHLTLTHVATLDNFRRGNYRLASFNAFPSIVKDNDQIAPPDHYMRIYTPLRDYYTRMLRIYRADLQSIKTQRQLRKHTARLEKELSGKTNSIGKIGIIRGVEGFYQGQEKSEGEVTWRETKAAARQIVRSGVRVFGLMWNEDSHYGKGTTDDIEIKPGEKALVVTEGPFKGVEYSQRDTGLTPLGRKLVRYLATRHISVDLSHSSPKTMMDTLDVLQKLTVPHAKAIATHVGSKHVTEHRRNAEDGILKHPELDFIGIPLVGKFVRRPDGRGNEATITDVVEHLVHFQRQHLLDKVGLGSDFNGTSPQNEVIGLANPAEVKQNLIDAMRARVHKKTGKRVFSEEDIAGVVYGNAATALSRNLPANWTSRHSAAFKENVRGAVSRLSLRRGRTA